MKCMPRNMITQAIATSENPNYPAANVLSDSQLVPWIAGAQNATITVSVPGGANGVGLVGVESVSVDIVVKDKDGQIVAQAEIDLSGIDDYLQWMTGTGQPRTSCGFIYPYQMDDHTIEITVDSGNSIVMPEIGRIGAGGVMIWREPLDLSMSQTEIGAVVEEFHDGGRYYLPGDIIKTFSGSIRHELSWEFWTWIERLGSSMKTNPCFWWVTDQDNVNLLIFARFKSLPAASFAGGYTTTKFELIEDKG